MSEWAWIGLEDNDSGCEMVKDIPVENVHEVVGLAVLNLR